MRLCMFDYQDTALQKTWVTIVVFERCDLCNESEHKELSKSFYDRMQYESLTQHFDEYVPS